MTGRTRRSHGPVFKAKAALAAIGGGRTPAGLARTRDVHPNRIAAWEAQPVEGAAGLFDGPAPAAKEAAPADDAGSLHARIGEPTIGGDFLAGAPGRAGPLSAGR